ncbi:hypothetical protein PUN28_006937 [Cardiocondyla obscurior]|uniref:Uncharacterized protein n=1 Tax=Cardiocondyla obscurior TaxID=286306 RepID=A0AAW2G459_9HYME
MSRWLLKAQAFSLIHLSETSDLYSQIISLNVSCRGIKLPRVHLLRVEITLSYPQLAYPQLSPLNENEVDRSPAEPLISRCTIGSANDELSLRRSCYYSFICGPPHRYSGSICSCDPCKTHRKTVYTNYFIIIRSRRLMIAICLVPSEAPLAKYVDDSYVKFRARGQRFIPESAWRK